MSESSQRSTPRSRKYPSLNLEQAIDRARVLYEIERQNSVPVDLVARHWGFKGISTGPASTAYSAVKQFGLIDETGGSAQRKAAISQRARAILTAPPEVRQKHIKDAALEPAMNRVIWERYGADTGSPDAFRWHLISELGFSDRGAGEFAKQYMATIRFAGLDQLDAEDEGGSPEPDDEQATTAAEPPEERSRPRSAPVDFSTIGTAIRATRHAIPLIGGQQVILEGDFPLTEAAWKGFMDVLKAFKPGLVAGEPEAAAMESEDDEDTLEARRGGE